MAKNPPRYVKATVVDHIVPHRGDPKLFWDRNELAASL
jgi:5-methylcytosine-specific restriction protein A